MPLQQNEPVPQQPASIEHELPTDGWLPGTTGCAQPDGGVDVVEVVVVPPGRPVVVVVEVVVVVVGQLQVPTLHVQPGP